MYMKFTRPRNRTGMSLIELVLACAVMVTIMSLVTTLCFRISLIWKDVGQHRVAAAELSNQLERLTKLKLEELTTKLESLETSEYCQRTLRSPIISGELSETEVGVQVDLKLNWQRRHAGVPMEMTGWITGGKE